MYEKVLHAGWAEMDFNGHMRNTAYLDKSGDVRMMFFADHGFPSSEFSRLQLGPVIMKDEVEYFRELKLLDTMRITLQQAGASADGSRFMIRNEFFRADGKRSATVNSLGGWLDLRARKLIAPPPELLKAMQSLGKTDDFQELTTSLR